MNGHKQISDWGGGFFVDSGAIYEVRLVAFNGNGDGNCSKRLVSLTEDGSSTKANGESNFESNFGSIFWSNPQANPDMPFQ